MSDEPRWIVRRSETLMLLDGRTMHRSVRVDCTVPAQLGERLALHAIVDEQGMPQGEPPSRVLVPLAVIPKEPLMLGLTVEGNDAEMLTRTVGRDCWCPRSRPEVRAAARASTACSSSSRR